MKLSKWQTFQLINQNKSTETHSDIFFITPPYGMIRLILTLFESRNAIF